MKRILYCVLDWGLGHATRSIPLISCLLRKHCDVQIASNGQALAYLQKYFPEVIFHQLSGYNARYPTTHLYVNVVSMVNRLSKAMATENKQVSSIVNDFQPEVIISDNRYGCYHAMTKNIFLSHQLKLLTGNTVAQIGADMLLRKKLNPFSELWVPDYPPPYHLTGMMSELDDERVCYIGPLSAMERIDTSLPRNKLLILLSGPEPARTKLENLLCSFNLQQRFDLQLIRGTSRPMEIQTENIEVLNMATPEEVSTAICSATYILCRSGYSTIMDLQKLGKTAIYIPTPAQPEQKYLADRMQLNSLGVAINEKELSYEKICQSIDQLKLLKSTRIAHIVNFSSELDRLLND